MAFSLRRQRAAPKERECSRLTFTSRTLELTEWHAAKRARLYHSRQ